MIPRKIIIEIHRFKLLQKNLIINFRFCYLYVSRIFELIFSTLPNVKVERNFYSSKIITYSPNTLKTIQSCNVIELHS
jgi:hypothetical protein